MVRLVFKGCRKRARVLCLGSARHMMRIAWRDTRFGPNRAQTGVRKTTGSAPSELADRRNSKDNGTLNRTRLEERRGRVITRLSSFRESPETRWGFVRLTGQHSARPVPRKRANTLLERRIRCFGRVKRRTFSLGDPPFRSIFARASAVRGMDPSRQDMANSALCEAVGNGERWWPRGGVDLL